MWHVWGATEVHICFWWGELMERAHLEDLGIDRIIILKCIFWRWVGKHEMDCYGSGYGLAEGMCKFGNENWGSIKGGEFLD
jgi:hypothetical protein